MKTVPRLMVSDEVRAVRARSGPLVALESTVLSHGLPRPRNLEVGHLLQSDVRDCGATPATIGVIGGMPTIGLSSAELGHLAMSEDVWKLSTRDLPTAVTCGADGATTVAATMWLGSRIGMQVFATGGIGGVHRGDSNDVSADLIELGRTPMIVVCAGPKAILDVAATREALETQGVLVVGWGTDRFPTFYAESEGLHVDARVDTAEEVAKLWSAHRDLGLPGALLLCVPPPADYILPAAEIEVVIERRLEEATRRGVRGKEITPFLLRTVAEETGGRALEANIALLRNNACVAAAVAIALRGEGDTPA